MNKTIISPGSRRSFLYNFQEIWTYRELFWTLVERDIRIRYKQTLIGGAWAILQPLMTMIVFSFFFGKLAKMPSEGVPYPIFSYAGLLLWTYFSTALNNASNSLVGNAGLITKVYFPRLIIPLSASLTPLFDYLFASSIMLILMLFYHVPLTSNLLFLPLIAILAWFLAAGVSFWFSAINVAYRDMKYVLTFVMSLWIYATPVIYPTSVADRFKIILLFNPMTGLIESHRSLILNQTIPYQSLILSICFTIIIYLSGIIHFKRAERYFADII